MRTLTLVAVLLLLQVAALANRYNKLYALSQRLYNEKIITIHPRVFVDYLIHISTAESSLLLNAKSRKTGDEGLWQWTAITRKELGVNNVHKYTIEQQVRLMYKHAKFLKSKFKRIKSREDLYKCLAFPNVRCITPKSRLWKFYKHLDLNHDKRICKKDLKLRLDDIRYY